MKDLNTLLALIREKDLAVEAAKAELLKARRLFDEEYRRQTAPAPHGLCNKILETLSDGKPRATSELAHLSRSNAYLYVALSRMHKAGRLSRSGTRQKYMYALPKKQKATKK